MPLQVPVFKRETAN